MANRKGSGVDSSLRGSPRRSDRPVMRVELRFQTAPTRDPVPAQALVGIESDTVPRGRVSQGCANVRFVLLASWLAAIDQGGSRQFKSRPEAQLGLKLSNITPVALGQRRGWNALSRRKYKLSALADRSMLCRRRWASTAVIRRGGAQRELVGRDQRVAIRSGDQRGRDGEQAGLVWIERHLP